MDRASVTAVIISHNTRELLLKAISSVQRCAGESVEIVVVDNASVDGSADGVRSRFASVRLIENQHNTGFGRACNQAISQTASEFVLLLNSDAELSEDTLKTLLECMHDVPKCGAAGCAVVDAEGVVIPNTRNYLTSFNQALEMLGLARWTRCGWIRRTYSPRPDSSGRDTGVDWIEGACLLIRRTAMEQVGHFDERFFMYSEDEDLCYRIRKAGWLVCFTSATHVRHVGAASTGPYGLEMLRHFYQSQLLFLLKHRGRLAVALYCFAMRTILLIKGHWPGPSTAASMDNREKAIQRLLALRLAHSSVLHS